MIGEEAIFQFIRNIEKRYKISHQEALTKIVTYYLSIVPLPKLKYLFKSYNVKNCPISDEYLLLELLLAAQIPGYDHYILEERDLFNKKYTRYAHPQCSIFNAHPVFRSTKKALNIRQLQNAQYNITWHDISNINYAYVNILPDSLHALYETYISNRSKLLLHYKKIPLELLFLILSYMTSFDSVSGKKIVPEIQPLLMDIHTWKKFLAMKKTH